MIPLYDDQRTRTYPVGTILLILINIYVFASWQEKVGVENSVDLAGFVPSDYIHKVPGATARLFTSMFMHGGWMHLIGNMWFLWVFGRAVEDACGFFRYLAFYILCGAAATAAYGLFSPTSHIPLVGASGAISGVLGAYLLRHPDARIVTFIPIVIFYRILAIPAWFFLLVWIGIQIASQILTEQHPGRETGGVAYLAHIGGFVAGMGIIFLFEKSERERTSARRSRADSSRS